MTAWHECAGTAIVYRLFISEADPNRALVVITPVRAVIMFALAYQEACEARAR